MYCSVVGFFCFFTFTSRVASFNKNSCLPLHVNNPSPVFVKPVYKKSTHFFSAIEFKFSLNSVSKENDSIPSTSLTLTFERFALFVGLPLITLLFSYLLAHITNPFQSSVNRQYYILSLLLLKRIYIYSVAYITLLISSKITVYYNGPNDLKLGKVLNFVSIR